MMTIKFIYHLLPMWVWEVFLFAAVIDGFILYVAVGDFILERMIDMKLSNKVYDILCYISKYVLPALGTLYFALSTIWGLPYGEQIVGTIAAVDAFIGAILGISTYNYNKDGD